MIHPILVLDDERDLRVTYERLLRRQGYRVVHADSRHQGLSIVQAEPLALVISDVRLSDGSGLDVVRAAQAAPTRAPAIVVTGFPSLETRRAALDAGASGFLAKPFAASDFTELVRRVLGDRQV